VAGWLLYLASPIVKQSYITQSLVEVVDIVTRGIIYGVVCSAFVYKSSCGVFKLPLLALFDVK